MKVSLTDSVNVFVKFDLLNSIQKKCLNSIQAIE